MRRQISARALLRVHFILLVVVVAGFAWLVPRLDGGDLAATLRSIDVGP